MKIFLFDKKNNIKYPLILPKDMNLGEFIKFSMDFLKTNKAEDIFWMLPTDRELKKFWTKKGE